MRPHIAPAPENHSEKVVVDTLLVTSSSSFFFFFSWRTLLALNCALSAQDSQAASQEYMGSGKGRLEKGPARSAYSIG